MTHPEAHTPRVSILLAVHNGETHLAAAVDSILTQQFSDLELIVINDCSTDSSPEILAGYSDPRLRVINNETNLGLASSLNRGWDAAQGEYIGRMDADDISYPARIARQVDFLDKHPDITVCGTWARTIGYRGGMILRFPEAHEHIRARFIFINAVSHPSVLIRAADLADEGPVYEDGRQRVEDYELWVRLSRKYRLHNLPEVLLDYRMYNPATLKKRRAVIAAGNEMRGMMLHEVGITPDDEDIALHEAIVFRQFEPTVEFIQRAEDWLDRITAANATSQAFDPDALHIEIRRNWYRVCKFSTAVGFDAWRLFWRSPHATGFPLLRIFTLGFFLRALLKLGPPG